MKRGHMAIYSRKPKEWVGISMNPTTNAPLLVCLCYFSKALLNCPTYFYPTLFHPTMFCMFNLAHAQNIITTRDIIIITTLLNPNNSTHYYFPNCCYGVVKHTNQENRNDIPCLLRVSTTTDDCWWSCNCSIQIKGPSFWRVLGFWNFF
jgi:hypothetical protein